MHTYYINKLIKIKELNITESDRKKNDIFLHAVPVDYIQPCPQCQSHQVIRRGTAYNRKVRHLPAFGCRVYFVLPSIRMSCKACAASFVWSYQCVMPGKRYTKAFEASIPSHVLGATTVHASKNVDVPYTTVERMYKKWLKKQCPKIQKSCLHAASSSSNLVLGMDDFAIRKGHSYNTGLHDLRGETLLDIIPGRKVADLKEYYAQHPQLHTLNPIAVVMDLALCYHNFVREVYPKAIRIADRFHVNRYVTDALHDIRKSVQEALPTRASKLVKQQKHLLEKRQDHLTSKEREQLDVLLGFSSLLRAAYEWKESFIEWYDCSTHYHLAKQGFLRWIQKGEMIQHDAIFHCLKTMKNWQEEICNYHKLRFTNAAVEGRNNQIKALQRRHYFTRNKQNYKQRILVECNQQLVSC